MPFATAISAYSPTRPMCIALTRLTVATFWSRALAIATSMAYSATTWPKVQFPETRAVVGVSVRISGQAVGTSMPSRISVTYRGRWKTPCVSTPLRFDDTSARATRVALRSSAPAASSTRLVRSCRSSAAMVGMGRFPPVTHRPGRSVHGSPRYRESEYRVRGNPFGAPPPRRARADSDPAGRTATSPPQRPSHQGRGGWARRPLSRRVRRIPRMELTEFFDNTTLVVLIFAASALGTGIASPSGSRSAEGASPALQKVTRWMSSSASRNA